MKRIFITLLLFMALLLTCASANAATKLTDAELVVNGQAVPLSGDTGYLFKSGDALMVPAQALCDALGVPWEADARNADLRMTPGSGIEVRLRVGARAMQVGKKKIPLRVKTGRQGAGLITADARLVKALGYDCKHYPPGAALRKLGYRSGVLVVSAKGESLLPPDLGSADAALPAALRGAAKQADQIVAIRYSGARSAEMALYEKVGGEWRKSISETAYVGSEGIGKTREGDKKTPTGTFNLTAPFGIKRDPGTKMGGYLKVNKNHYWSGQNGEHYNRLVDIGKVEGYKPSSKDEHLIDYAGVYNHCFFIDYNKDGEKDKGSAIFLHCQGKANYTGGCVAVPERVMVKLLETLDAGAKIVIYQ